MANARKRDESFDYCTSHKTGLSIDQNPPKTINPLDKNEIYLLN
jgi:hypothetical protein